MNKKRSVSLKKPVRNSQKQIKKKAPLQALIDNQVHLTTPHQKSLPKTKNTTHTAANDQRRTINQNPRKSTKPNRRKNSSPKRHAPENNRYEQKELQQNYYQPHRTNGHAGDNDPRNYSSSDRKQNRNRSKDYDSPDKDHEDFHYMIMEPYNKVSKAEAGEIEAGISAARDLLTKNMTSQAVELLEKIRQVEGGNNYEVNYLIGICRLVTEKYAEAAEVFKGLLGTRKPKKNLYLLLSVCLKKLDNLEAAAQVLDVCLQRHPKFYEAHIYRGKLKVRLREFQDAFQDFDSAIQLHPQRSLGYLGRGDCLRACEQYEAAVLSYNLALQKEAGSGALLRRAICYLELGRHDQSLTDINALLDRDPQNSEALYFKGLLNSRKNSYNQAIICFQQAIKFNTNKKAVARAIYEIAKIKIQLRDYYEAFYTLERAQYLDIDPKTLSKFRTFIEGVTNLMKKNFQKGIELLNGLVQDHTLSRFLKPLFYSARAYGLMYLEKFEEAKTELSRLEKQFSLDALNAYNKFICQGIISSGADKYVQALGYFSKAGKLFPRRLQPCFYKAVTLVNFANKLIPKNMPEKKMEYLQTAMKTVAKADAIPENNPSLFLVRGVLYFSLGDISNAIEDITTAINQYNNQPSVAARYFRGVAYGSLGQLDKAVEDLNAAAEQDRRKRHYPEIFLNRAKCFLLSGQANKAFSDLQTYMNFRPSSPDIHIWAGHFLFTIGSYQDAAKKAYSSVSNLQKNPKVLLQRAKAYLACKDIASASQDLKTILENPPTEQASHASVQLDYIMLEGFASAARAIDECDIILGAIKQAKKQSPSGEGLIFKKADVKFYQGVYNFFLGKYDKSIRKFQKSLRIRSEQFSEETLGTQPEQSHVLALKFSNSAYNIYELKYNLVVCYILNGELPKAIKQIKGILSTLENAKVNSQFEALLKAVQAQIKAQLVTSKPKSFEEEGDAELFAPFPFDKRLCACFPEVLLPLQNPLRTRLSFCLPFVPKPDIRPQFDSKLLEDVSMKWIEVKPEAPWIRRSEQGVIFTDQVVAYDVELSESSEGHAQGEEDQQHSEEQRVHDNRYIQREHDYGMEQQQLELRQSEAYQQYMQQPYSRERYHDDDQSQGVLNRARVYQEDYEEAEQPPAQRHNPAELRKIFQLDPQIERKLNAQLKNIK